MKIQKILVAGLFIIVLGTLTACQKNKSNDALKQIKEKGILTVALSPDDPPFEYQTIEDGKNSIVGSDIDLANEIGKSLGVKVKFQSMDFNNVLTALASGKADMAISDISYTAKRAQTYDLSTIYYHTKNVMLIQKSNMNKYKEISDLKGQKIAVQKGTVQEELAQKKMPQLTAIALSQMAPEVTEVKNGQVAGAIMEKTTAESFVVANPDLVIADMTLPELTDASGMVIAMPKGSGDLTKEVNKIIDQLLKENKIEKSIQKHFQLGQTK
ncbi:MAG: transporter substrate-binding domain-containing protein [Lactococcus sp.]